MATIWAQAKRTFSSSRPTRRTHFSVSLQFCSALAASQMSRQLIARSTRISITSYGQQIPRGSSVLHDTRGSNQAMKRIAARVKTSVARFTHQIPFQPRSPPRYAYLCLVRW